MTQPCSFSFRTGETITIPLRLLPSTDLTGMTLEWRGTGFQSGESLVRNNLDSAAAGYAGGLTLTDPTHGKLALVFQRADTADLDPDTYFWSLRRLDSGYESVLLEGSCYLLPCPDGA